MSDQTKQERFDSPVYENPVFIGLVGLCPALFVTTQLSQSVVLALATAFVMIASAPLLTLIESRVSGRVRFMVVIAIIGALTTLVEVLLELIYPEMRARLGIFVPLIAVNCLVLRTASQAEEGGTPGELTIAAAYTSAAFFIALSGIVVIRELLGTGGLSWGPISLSVPGLAHGPVRFVGTAGGALLVLGYIRALVSYSRLRAAESEAPK